MDLIASVAEYFYSLYNYMALRNDLLLKSGQKKAANNEDNIQDIKERTETSAEIWI